MFLLLSGFRIYWTSCLWSSSSKHVWWLLFQSCICSLFKRQSILSHIVHLENGKRVLFDCSVLWKFLAKHTMGRAFTPFRFSSKFSKFLLYSHNFFGLAGAHLVLCPLRTGTLGIQMHAHDRDLLPSLRLVGGAGGFSLWKWASTVFPPKLRIQIYFHLHSKVRSPWKQFI